MRVPLGVVTILSVFFLCIQTYSQEKDFIPNSKLGIQFFVHNYSNGKKGINLASKTFPGFAVSFSRASSRHFDWTTTVYFAFVDSILQTKDPFRQNDLFIDANFSIRARPFSNEKRIQPFFQSGIGMIQYKNYGSLVIPMGMGVQASINKKAFLTLETKYSLPLASNFRPYFSHSLGISGLIGKSKRRAVKSKVLEHEQIQFLLDKDHDGIFDTVDICPAVPGLKEFSGCPDGDRDGVPDRSDECPHVPGMIEYKGCPASDTDKDGILDIADKCIDVPGLKEYQGCPETDRDHDGIGDKYDECPDVKGIRENYGCPEICKETKLSVSNAAQNIFFNTGSCVLLPTSFKSLDEVATILNKNPKMKLRIEGHTDDVNDSMQNQKLSEQRANAVMKYLITKGIEQNRLTTRGFGESVPLIKNKNSETRAINRRVELTLLY